MRIVIAMVALYSVFYCIVVRVTIRRHCSHDVVLLPKLLAGRISFGECFYV